VNYLGYGLDYDWELMPGRWKFAIYDGNRKLGGMAFDVVEGDVAPTPPSGDSSCFQVSSL
jgi:hypothetical protein